MAVNLIVVTGVSAVTAPASAAPDPNLGPIAPPGETFCYASADNGNRAAFIRMVGAPGDPGFTVQVDRLRVALGRSDVEALAIRPSGGIYMVDDGDPGELGRMVPGLFDPTVDNDAGTNPTANGAFSRIADLNDGAGNDLNLDVDGLTFIETSNLTAADDLLVGAVRYGGDDEVITIDPATAEVTGGWPIIAPPELVVTPDDDGITNITADDVDDIAWDPASDQIYAVLGGSSLNYMGRLVWVLDDGAGGTTTSATVPRGGGGAPDFSDVLRLNFVRLGLPANEDIEGLGFSNVGATFGIFFGQVGNGGTDDDELLVFDKATGGSTTLIDVKSDAVQGTGDEDYEALDCVQPEQPAALTIGELATPSDGTQFGFGGGVYGNIGPGDTDDGLVDGATEAKTVNAGTYVITQDPEAGWSLDDITCTGDNGFGASDWSIDLGARELTVTVASGQNASCTFENSQLAASVGDRVWLDTNGDGIQNGAEAGINGVTMTLRDGGGAIVATQDTAGDGDYDFTGLTPGTYSVEVDPADLPAGVLQTFDVDGVATAHIGTVTIGAGDDRDDVDFGYVPNLLDVAKTDYAGHDSGASCPGGESVTGLNGDEVTYCFVVTNTGGATLAPVTLADTDVGIDQTDMTVLSGSLASLAPGQSVSLHYDATIAGDLLNTVEAQGVTSSGAVLSATDTASVDEVAPAIQVDKTVYVGHDAGASCAGVESVTGSNGDAVTYCFSVTNTGATALVAVQVDDLDVGVDQDAMTILSGSLLALLPSESVSLFYETAISGDLVNTATASGTPPAGPDPTDDDTAEVDEVAPGIRIDKTVYAGHDAGVSCEGVESVTALNGDAVTYCFVVTNTGDTALTDVQVDDGDLGIDELNMTVSSGSLASVPATESVTLYYETTIDGDLLNTATATGTPPVGEDPTDDDTAEVTELVPAVSIDKTVYTGHDAGASCAGVESVTGLNGDAVTYCFSVTNTGDTALDIAVDDADLGIDETGMTVGSGTLTGLAAGATVELYIETTIDGDLFNTATVTGTSPAGDTPTDDDTAEVDEVAPGIRIDKTVYAGHDAGVSCAGVESVTALNGDAVTYCFSVTNTGDTALVAVQVDDADLGIDQTDMTVTAGSLLALPAGQTVDLYYETTVAGDLVNTATVSGTPPVGPDPSDDDTAEVDEVVPEIGVAKTITEQPEGNGDGTYTLTYGIEVQNTGEVPLDGVQLTDDLQATFADAVGFEVEKVTSADLTVNWPGFDGIAVGDPHLLAGTDGLALGETGTVLVTVTVTPGANLGPYENSAIGSATSPFDEKVTDFSDSGNDSDPTRSNPDEPGDTGGTDDPVPTEFPPIDLTITKVADKDVLPATGGTIDWTLLVTNNGPGDDAGPITMVDELPPSLEFVAAGGDGWICDDADSTVTCVWDAPLAAGADTTPITITTASYDPGRGAITNGAEVSSTGTETSTTNNDDDAEVTVSGTEVVPTPDATPDTLPRTGAAIGGLVLLGLGLVFGGRMLVGRRRRFT